MAPPQKSRRLTKACNLCTEQVTQIDYKNVELLKTFISDYGRITPRYLNSNCSRHQRMLARAVKLARYMAFLPYVGTVIIEEQ